MVLCFLFWQRHYSLYSSSSWRPRRKSFDCVEPFVQMLHSTLFNQIIHISFYELDMCVEYQHHKATRLLDKYFSVVPSFVWFNPLPFYLCDRRKILSWYNNVMPCDHIKQAHGWTFGNQQIENIVSNRSFDYIFTISDLKIDYILIATTSPIL